MKFCVQAAFSLLLLLPQQASPFVVQTNSKILSTPRGMASAMQGDVVPPPEAGENIVDMYNANVQTTYGRYPLTIRSGRGCTLTTDKDEKYLDFVSGIATCALGHGHPALSQAISNQMQSLHHVSNLYYIPAQAQLAKWLCDNSVADKAFFCNSGAEANEAAIKLARKHAAKERGITDPIILTAHGSFHGRTLAAITATAQPKYHEGFTYGGEMVSGFHYVEYNNIQDLEETVAKLNKTPPQLKLKGRKRGVAAILLEPLQGEGGVIPGNPLFFHRARQLMDECGGLLMCDEVQIGMGRSGSLWGYQQLNVEPDVFTSAKALGGGVPIGAMMAKGKAAETFQPGDHASTYGGNPLACAAGLAVARTICNQNLLQNVQDRGQELVDGLNELCTKYPTVLDQVRGWGLLQGAVVKEGHGAGDIVKAAMQEGLLLVPAGGQVVRFVPPLIVSSTEIKTALSKFDKALETYAAP